MKVGESIRREVASIDGRINKEVAEERRDNIYSYITAEATLNIYNPIDDTLKFPISWDIARKVRRKI
jgi:hypothetical protein